jgi:peptide/nickel transport system substrate-binding protein
LLLKKLRWQFLIVLLALVVIVALLLSQQPSKTITGEQRPDQPVKGGVYTEALVGSLGRLNPLLDTYNSVDYDVDRLLYSSLIQFDSRGLPHGDLAETWGISQDGKVYNFSIRPNAQWHDGQPVTSDDIIFTVNLLRDENTPVPDDLKAFWKQITVEALDEKTIQFRLPEPFSPFLDYLTFGILPQHLLKDVSPKDLANAQFNLSPVGSGPFRFEGVNVENGKITAVVLRAFSQYYGDKPFLDQVVFRYYPDEKTALDAFDKGEVLGVNQISTPNLTRAFAEPNMNLFASRLPRLDLIYLNLGDPKLPFFQDAAVRRALLMGLNRQWIIDRLLEGQAIQANGPIFPDNWAYYQGVESIAYDSDAAVALLKKAGYTIPAEGGTVRSKDGVSLSFDLVYPEGDLSRAIAERVQQDWARIGVNVNLKPVSVESLMKDYLEPRSYQAALAELNFDRSPDPDPYPFWHQAQIANGQNYSQWDDRQVSEYLEEARVQLDLSERIKRYRNFQVRFASELPALPLFYPVYSWGISNKVNGASMGPVYDPSDRFNTVLSWYLLSGPAAAQVVVTATP